jgi:ABC-type transporter Mla maintaining outer membrane lipid asymmetry ATPase subunit MlaF
LPDEPGITLDRVHFGFDRGNILNEITWELSQGHSAAIQGASGSGKSTLLLIAAGLIPPKSGAVLLGAHPLARLSPSERIRRGLRIGFVFQDGGLFANMDTYANVSLPLYYHRDVLGLDEASIGERTREVLEVAQIEERHWHTLPAHLSFGDRKRLAMARALAIRPNYFFFDDPDIGMDHRTANVAHHILTQLKEDPAVTLLVATNRNKLIDRLQIAGFRLENGHLHRKDGTSQAPSGWSLPPKISGH